MVPTDPSVTSPPNLVPARSALADYRDRGSDVGSGVRYDELLDVDGCVREQWSELASGLDRAGTGGEAALQGRVQRLVDEHGITYNPIPPDRQIGVAGPVRWGLDGIPLVLDAEDWGRLEVGLLQRSRVLDALLTDLYGPMETLRRGLIPPELVFGDPNYLRAAHGITIPGPRQLFLHAADVGRGSDGAFRVYADRTQAPSGIGYALADRRVMSRAAPELFQDTNPRPLSTFARALRLALIDVAPAAAENPVVVVLSPGDRSETAFDQAYLATVLGFPLVENADLVVREGCLWMRSLGRLRRVDVVLRRVDAAFTDPLDLRSDSRLGVVGLVDVLRRGAVTVVNTLGSGVLENPALPTLLPALARALLDEDLLLESTPAVWGGAKHGLSYLTAHARSLVFRSVSSRTVVVGHELDDAGVDSFVKRLRDEPGRWVGQEVPEFSVAPSGSGVGADIGFSADTDLETRIGLDAGSGAIGSGRIGASQVGVRLFTVAQRVGYTPMTGGLGQVLITSPVTEPLIEVASKDVWVRSPERANPSNSAPNTPSASVEEQPHYAAALGVDVAGSPRVLGDLYWFGRYAERAEDMTRLLIAARERHQDFRSMPWLDGSDSLPVILRAVTRVSGTGSGFFDERTRNTALAEFRSLTVSADRPGSVAQSVERMQEAARRVRDQLSIDTWAVFGRIDAAMNELVRSTAGDEAQLAASQSAVLRGLLALSGLASESMVRDAGWYFMDCGRRIERGLQLTALLSATVGHALTPSTEQAVIDSVLSAAESAVVYRRRNRGPARPAALAQLLLLDEFNPRSLVYQLNRLGDDFSALPDASGTSPAELLVEQMAARVRRVDPGDLESVDASGRRGQLVDLVDDIHERLEELSRVVVATHMVLPGETQPLWGTVGATRARRGVGGDGL